MSREFPSVYRGPFPVRPHHLEFIMSLNTQAPEEIASQLRKTAASMINLRDPDLTLLDDPTNESRSDFYGWSSAYGFDVVGDTPEQARAYEAGVSAYLKRFIELEPDAPVSIGVGVLDGICQSTTFKRHCQNMSPVHHTNDVTILSMFRNICDNLGSITISASETDGVITTIHTDADTTRRVAAEILDKKPDKSEVNGDWIRTAAAQFSQYGDPYYDPYAFLRESFDS